MAHSGRSDSRLTLGSLKFLIDMPLAAPVAVELRAAGHDAVHLREQWLGRLADEEILAKAVVEGRIVVTADLDFEALLARAGNATASVIVFRLANLQADRVCALLTKVLAQAANELKRGAVVLVEESRFRIRHLPLGN
jgi:predicted nuclease of predicted toxin-antitoxin system